MRAVIFANGDLNVSSYVRSAAYGGELVIAADGGARHCLSLDLVPEIVIGDFDSMEPEELVELEAMGANLIRHPERKDYTDLELALQHALALGAREIIVLGALGKRWDQTLANLLLPASAGFSSVPIRLLDGHQEINLLRSGQALELQGQPGDTVSLIPLLGDAGGITTLGLEYPLVDGNLSFGSTRGVSNAMTQESATVRLTSGLLLVVLIHGAFSEASLRQ